MIYRRPGLDRGDKLLLIKPNRYELDEDEADWVDCILKPPRARWDSLLAHISQISHISAP